jgi:hypothetical protein
MASHKTVNKTEKKRQTSGEANEGLRGSASLGLNEVIFEGEADASHHSVHITVRIGFIGNGLN